MLVDITKNQSLLKEFNDFKIYRSIDCPNCNMCCLIICETLYSLSKDNYIKNIFLKIPTHDINDKSSIRFIEFIINFNCIKCDTPLSCKQRYSLDLNKKERLKTLLELDRQQN